MGGGHVSPDFLYLAGLTVVALEVFAGFLGNGFIVTVNVLDWLKNKRLNPVDHILVLLAISNAGLCCAYGYLIFFTFTWPEFFLGEYAYPVSFAFLLMMTFSSSWLIAWLCLYFCFKIIPFKSSILSKVKMSIDSAVVWLILISEMASAVYSIPVIWLFGKPQQQNPNTTHNISQTIASCRVNNSYLIWTTGISSFIASFIVIVSLVSIIWSLGMHTYQMKKRISPEDDSLLKTHRSAAKTVLSLLLVYVTYYISVILVSTVLSCDDFGILYWLIMWTLMSISPALSVVLILGNSKLWLALQKIRPHKILSR